MSVTVYELYDGEGGALYVGATVNVPARLATHRRKPWWAQVDQGATVLTPYATASSAARAERDRISALRPRHNVRGVTSDHTSYPVSWRRDTAQEGLNAHGLALTAAHDAVDRALAAARTAAIAAMGAGMSESEAARQYGVTRMTIRAWKANQD